VVLVAVIGQLCLQPAHIVHHLREDSGHDPASTRDDCAQCAVFHGGGQSLPEIEAEFSPTVSAVPLEEIERVVRPVLLTISATSRAPPDCAC
jgi:hypothetical protein